MINVSLTKRAEKDQLRIAIYLRKQLPGGNDEEVTAATRFIGAEMFKVARALAQLRRLPAGVIRKIIMHARERRAF